MNTIMRERVRCKGAFDTAGFNETAKSDGIRPIGFMVHSEGVFTNQILEELAGWEKILQHTSLSQTFDPDELEGEDEDAPRDRRLATVRRRRRRS